MANRTRDIMPTSSRFTKFSQLPKEIRFMIWEAALPGGRIVEILQRPLHMRVGEWNWPGAPENLSEQDRIDYLTAYETPTGWHQGSPESLRIQHILGYFSLEEVDISVPDCYDFEPPSDGDFDIEDNLDLPMPGIMTPCPAPSVLFVCRESYRVASQIYKKSFATHAGFAQTYFAPQRDTLYLKYDTFSYITLRVFHNALCPLDSITDIDSLKSVESLAILADPDCRALDYRRDGQRNNFTDFVKDVLSIFNNLKDLTVVLKHYDTIDGDAPDSDTSTFEDPVDLGMLIDGYKDFCAEAEYRPEEMPVPHMLDQHHVKVDLKELEMRRPVLVINGQEPWRMPRIHYKVSVTYSFEAELDEAREECEIIIEEENDDW